MLYFYTVDVTFYQVKLLVSYNIQITNLKFDLVKYEIYIK